MYSKTCIERVKYKRTNRKIMVEQKCEVEL